jgi:hypothetical protein
MGKEKIKIEDFKEFLLFLILGVILILLLFSLYSIPIEGVIGTPNATVTSELTVGNVYPEILNVSIDNDAATVTLVANSTKLVICEALIIDYNNESDIDTVTARFFDESNSSYGGTPDNNNHYRNNSCDINRTFGTWRGIADDEYLALGNCTFSVWYYANPSEWNCTVWVNDTANLNDTGSDNITVSELLAIALPDTINYGTVNALEVSSENTTNVTNVGNVNLNLSLSGYARTPGDNLAMNCTLGSNRTIPIYYEQYNLTASNTSTLNFSQFDSLYVNLTSNVVTREFNLNYRQNDTNTHAANATYWRIYVPIGVAGTCNGSVVFGATQADGT